MKHFIFLKCYSLMERAYKGKSKVSIVLTIKVPHTLCVSTLINFRVHKRGGEVLKKRVKQGIVPGKFGWCYEIPSNHNTSNSWSVEFPVCWISIFTKFQICQISIFAKNFFRQIPLYTEFTIRQTGYHFWNKKIGKILGKSSQKNSHSSFNFTARKLKFFAQV